MKILFIHRSVGRNLMVEGGLRDLLQERGVALDDYNNNNGILTASDGSIAANAIKMPGNNTNPDNLAQYFMNWDGLLGDYELIVVKSCYPNSRIKDDTQLKLVQQSYQAIFEAFAAHERCLKLLTSPPLRPGFTNRAQADFADRLNKWLLDSQNEYVQVLDFHALLAEEEGRNRGMLCREYRRWLPFDNHPNRKANQELAVVVAEFVAGNLPE